MTRVSFRSQLGIFECPEGSIAEQYAQGAGAFRIHVEPDEVPDVGSEHALIDRDGWRMECALINVETPCVAGHENCRGLVFKPVGPGIRGRRVDGTWQPCDD